MTKFTIGGAMGFMLGAGLMMSSAGRTLRRDMKRKACMMRRWMRTM